MFVIKKNDIERRAMNTDALYYTLVALEVTSKDAITICNKWVDNSKVGEVYTFNNITIENVSDEII